MAFSLDNADNADELSSSQVPTPLGERATHGECVPPPRASALQIVQVSSGHKPMAEKSDSYRFSVEGENIAFDSYQKKLRWQERKAGIEEKYRRSDAWESWLQQFEWQFRIDQTYRVGTDSCCIDYLSLDVARRSHRKFLERLGEGVGKRWLACTVAELQKRGTIHWHTLIRFGGDPPHMPYEWVKGIWQYWRGWPPARQKYGIEGHIWLLYLKKMNQRENAIKYVVKYILKTGCSDALWFDVPERGIHQPQLW